MTQIITIILLLFLPLFTSHTTSRRILHQPFFPATDPPPPPPSPPPQTTTQPPSPSPSPLPKQPFSSITPTTPTHHHHNHPFFFPLSTTPPTTTTVPSTTLPTFPANISSITLPSPQPSSKSHVSKKLLFLSLSLSLLSILFISTMVATFLYHRSRHHKPQDDNHLLPPNHPTSDKPGPPSLPPNSSTPSTEFLYLGTLFSPMHNHANATNDFMGSPELHPLPPLVRKVHGNVEEGFKEKVVVAAPLQPPAAVAAGGGGSGVKLKGLHWDKVRGSSDKAMVWDQFKFRSSFR